MQEHKSPDVIKKVVWNLFVYVLYYVYCFIMLLIVHFILYRFIKSMDWTVRDIAVYAFGASTVMMAVRIAGWIFRRK